MCRPGTQLNHFGVRPDTRNQGNGLQAGGVINIDIGRHDPPADTTTTKVNPHGAADLSPGGSGEEIVEFLIRTGGVGKDPDRASRLVHSEADGGRELVETRQRLPTETWPAKMPVGRRCAVAGLQQV